MHEVRAAIVAETIRKHPFRGPKDDEDLNAYCHALLEHVKTVVDLSTRWELEFDKRQKDWSPAEVKQFFDAMQVAGGPPDALEAGLHAYQFMQTTKHLVTDAELLEIADRGLAGTVQMRLDQPRKDLAVILSVLMLNGECWTTAVSSKDRLGLIKYLAKTRPVFGFVLTADAWMHGINLTTKIADRREVIMQHVGSRDCRRVRLRPYRVTRRRAVFDDPPPPDLDPRTDPSVGPDPYADVFVTVPLPTGKPS